jgi:dihydrofolate reductase
MLYLIAAVSDNNIIGIHGKLPWSLQQNLQWFRMHTLQGAVIMGRKTWESLPYKPLKDRVNIVLTRGSCPTPSTDIIWKNSLASAIKYAYEHASRIYIIGGNELFHEAFAYTLQGIILTRVHVTINSPKSRALSLPINKTLVYRSQEQHEKLLTYHFELYIF